MIIVMFGVAKLAKLGRHWLQVLTWCWLFLQRVSRNTWGKKAESFKRKHGTERKRERESERERERKREIDR